MRESNVCELHLVFSENASWPTIAYKPIIVSIKDLQYQRDREVLVSDYTLTINHLKDSVAEMIQSQGKF